MMSEMSRTEHTGSSPQRRRAVFHSLKKRAEFLTAQRRGVKRVMPCLILQACQPAVSGKDLSETAPSDGLSHIRPQIRVGFTASRKVGNAVARNRAKRRMRALAQLILAPQTAETEDTGNPAGTRTDYVFIARQNMLSAQWDDAVRQAEKALADVNRQLDRRK